MDGKAVFTADKTTSFHVKSNLMADYGLQHGLTFTSETECGLVEDFHAQRLALYAEIVCFRCQKRVVLFTINVVRKNAWVYSPREFLNEAIMKAFLLLFLVLTNVNAACYAGGEVYSRVCNYSQVRGVKIQHPSGMLLTACLNRRMLGESYETSADTLCESGYVDGVITTTSEGLDSKTCLKEDSLGEVYDTSAEHACAFGYGSDDTRTYREGREIKFCVKGRDH